MRIGYAQVRHETKHRAQVPHTPSRPEMISRKISGDALVDKRIQSERRIVFRSTRGYVNTILTGMAHWEDLRD